MSKGCVNRGTANFDCSNRVQYPDGTLKRLEVWILVRKYAESAIVDAEADTRMNVLLSGLEPSIRGSLWDRNRKQRLPVWGEGEMQTCLKM